MASNERVRRVLQATADLSKEEREELVAELILGLEGESEPDAGYEEAWTAEIKRRVDDVVAGRSRGIPWAEARRQILANLERRRRAT